MYYTDKEKISCMIIGINQGRRNDTSSLSEISALVIELGYDISATLSYKVREPGKKLFLGTGQAEEIAAICLEKEPDVLIIDTDLSPAQQRNWENLTKIPVKDRTEIILDIFAIHARTRQASLQTEKARLEYQLPRLRRAWLHLGRQRGGRYGTRGEGETQLEMDRRSILARLARIKKELAELEKQDSTRRERRMDAGVIRAAIVGYTNAGKSALFKALTGTDKPSDDRPFVTLDTTTRIWFIEDWGKIVLSDTVGFIQNLPHTLVEAFKATLREVCQAHLLLEVIDSSDDNYLSHIQTTQQVLREIGAETIPRIRVYNKADKTENTMVFDSSDFPYTSVSAVKKTGLDELSALVTHTLEKHYSIETAFFSHPDIPDEKSLQSNINGTIIGKKYTKEGLVIKYINYT
ncbi:GTPase HflX [Spirochaetia bacterium 38H-sp]|uniref:GTPase HflX n=1 Tax=Rarispira pelagica TaxID=3141764 RepID=A0ABU9U9Y1_9SPIR